ncbi:response regulator transcription factor [uncultured Muribaculum sp.]|uniref:response regulator transcription factor n=1 Tax=uncultured Muribaculum sp. TaxID=1918613 RepID=UPI0025E0B890|nr:response regulator transcription factor [uncultured Muribaculum sp.]
MARPTISQKEATCDTRILVVDDEDTLCDTLRFNLELEGYCVDTAYSAEEALAMDLSSYSLILLDVMMGEISGFQMARIIKKNPALADIPVIFCTAKDTEDDMVDGLNLGADDYIAKPYSIRNIIARVKSVLRRSQPRHAHPTSSDRIVFEGLTVDKSLKRCMVDDTEVKLPRKEFEMLCLMLENPGKIFSREDFLKRIWPEEIIVVDRVVDVNITRLRSKLGRYGKMIVTRSGYGYGWQT